MKEKIIWFDNVRVIATLAVIVLHVAAPILQEYGQVSEMSWNIGNFFDSLVRFCVPVFFMLSGALLLNKDYELGYFFKKRFWRIIPPLIFWSLIYIFYDYFLVNEEPFRLVSFVKTVIVSLLYGSKFHLWFVYTLLGLYLFIPILRKWIKHSNNTEIFYFLIIWFASIICSLPYLEDYLQIIPLTNFSGFIGFLVLGYYLSKLRIRSVYLPILFIIVGVGITVYGTYYLTHKRNEFSEYFYGNFTPNVIISSIGMFLLFKSLRLNNERIKKAILFFSNQSFGIYLVHILILNLLNKIGINWEVTNPIISISITSIICFLLSSLTIYLLRKIKYGNYVSG